MLDSFYILCLSFCGKIEIICVVCWLQSPAFWMYQHTPYNFTDTDFCLQTQLSQFNGENCTFLKMKQNNSEEKFVLTSFDRIAPSQRQESVPGSFN